MAHSKIIFQDQRIREAREENPDAFVLVEYLNIYGGKVVEENVSEEELDIVANGSGLAKWLNPMLNRITKL